MTTTRTTPTPATLKLPLTSNLIKRALAAGCDLADLGLLMFLIDATWWSQDDRAWTITIAHLTIANRLNISTDTVARRLRTLTSAGCIAVSVPHPRASSIIALIDQDAPQPSAQPPAEPRSEPVVAANLRTQTPHACGLRLRTAADSDPARLRTQTPHGCGSLQVRQGRSQQQQQQRERFYNDATSTTPSTAAAAAGAAESRSASPGEEPPITPQERIAMIVDIQRALLIRPRWLASDRPWLDERTAAKIAAEMQRRREMTPERSDIELYRVLTEARRRSATLTNVVGYVINELMAGPPATSAINWPREYDHYLRDCQHDPSRDVHNFALRLAWPDSDQRPPTPQRYA